MHRPDSKQCIESNRKTEPLTGFNSNDCFPTRRGTARTWKVDLRLLHGLSRCAWESLKVFIQDVIPENNPLPGAVIAVQTFGDFLGFNPHCHILITDGCFYGRGMFRVAPPLELKRLEAIFRHKVLRMLIAKGKITREMMTLLSGWRHSGFHVFCGKRIFPKEKTAWENLTRYIIRTAFSQKQMRYIRNKETVTYALQMTIVCFIW